MTGHRQPTSEVCGGSLRAGARLRVLRSSQAAPASTDGAVVVEWPALRAELRGARALRHVLRYRSVDLLERDIETSSRPFLASLAARAISRGPCRLVDDAGRSVRVTPWMLARSGARAAADGLAAGAQVRRFSAAVASLEGAPHAGGTFDRARTPLYVRSDLVFGVTSGGSVGHIAGVVNNLAAFTAAPLLVTTDTIPTVDGGIETRVIGAPRRFREHAELAAMAGHEHTLDRSRRACAGRAIGFVYQRSSLLNLSGLALARERGVPLVLEYNGSEAWIARHWGQALAHEALALRAEAVNLRGADLVVVVSRAMRDEVVSRGVDTRRVLVNFNGVDPSAYHPEIDGSAARSSLGLGDGVVIGFIGTFGPWHGAEVLAEAFVRLCAARGPGDAPVRLLLIGSGDRLPATRRALESGGVLDRVAFAGRVPQAEGPRYLAACDVLASPHVPNPDGTPFFGSPTKLFEYMAMGRAIAASSLDQIAEVLEDGRTALLVPPGDASALARALGVLVDDAGLRRSLGGAARDEAVARHTWRAHTGRIVDALDRVVAGGEA